jgi:hypothetical protein
MRCQQATLITRATQTEGLTFSHHNFLSIHKIEPKTMRQRAVVKCTGAGGSPLGIAAGAPSQFQQRQRCRPWRGSARAHGMAARPPCAHLLMSSLAMAADTSRGCSGRGAGGGTWGLTGPFRSTGTPYGTGGCRTGAAAAGGPSVRGAALLADQLPGAAPLWPPSALSALPFELSGCATLATGAAPGAGLPATLGVCGTGGATSKQPALLSTPIAMLTWQGTGRRLAQPHVTYSCQYMPAAHTASA